MGRIEDLAAEYERHICVPWQRTITGAQRVVMVVYEKHLERTLRARLGEFEQRTTRHGHPWINYDCTTLFAEWMAAADYREAYFESPDDLDMKLRDEFLDYVAEPLREQLLAADADTVVAMTGVASLYGFARVSDVIRSVEPDIAGRLVVFFPGTKDDNVYRLLDARDGWNYQAHCITVHDAGGTA
ncbi:MAG: BREX protein BrxB domain-containing protein [Salinibacter sp.]